jgi:hemophore-related protein
MFRSGRTTCQGVAVVIGSGVISGLMFIGGSSPAVADPTPPPPAPLGCSAGDLARVAGGVADGTSVYLFTHPDVNNFFTSLRGQPRDEIRGDVKTFMDANPQVHADLLAIRQPLTDLRNQCGDTPDPMG